MEAILQWADFRVRQSERHPDPPQGSRQRGFTDCWAKEIMNDGKMGLNVRLKPGDYIIVKESMF